MSKSAYISFVLGVAIGSVATFFVVKKKFEAITNEEIAKFKEEYPSRYALGKNLCEGFEEGFTSDKKKEEKKVVEDATVATHDDLMKYARKIGEDNEYTTYATENVEPKTIKIPKTNPEEVPYAISSTEFGEYFDYEQIHLSFYADGILADDNNEIVYDADRTVGEDFEQYFDTCGDDTIYIRNEARKCDYEIYRDLRTFDMVIEDGSFRDDSE